MAFRLNASPSDIASSWVFDIADSDGVTVGAAGGDGVRDQLIIRPDARDESPLGRWEVTVLDPTGVYFISWGGEASPSDSIVWDGYSETGELVQAATDYELIPHIAAYYGR